MRFVGSAITYSDATRSLLSHVGNSAVFFDQNSVSSITLSVGNHEGMVLREEAIGIAEEQLYKSQQS